MAGEARLARGPVDQYGCVRWGPVDLPEGETEATLENIKRDLLNIYSGMPSIVFLGEGMSGAERAEPMMEKTCIILRKYLNKVPAAAMSEIKHYRRQLVEEDRPSWITVQHWTTQRSVMFWPAMIQTLTRLPASCCSLCCTSESLMLEVHPCATAVDVNTAELPGTPCLIIQGDMMKPSGWLISIKGHVVMGPYPLFLHGVALSSAAITYSTLSILPLDLRHWSSFKGASWASILKEAQRPRSGQL
ncbi:uncharacterized protein LOC113115674 isoform X2 [Carassius auratus]|uniref:Uncharacterized protein LOC113115674 isoform X2 n=1 Tax=Carassius auratus TaxID=7957 RepID=A0A6P6QZX4_CARAU|nr:uncharacterized protein LOC113115674 isoform X2 [Carassius auratus]